MGEELILNQFQAKSQSLKQHAKRKRSLANSSYQEMNRRNYYRTSKIKNYDKQPTAPAEKENNNKTISLQTLPNATMQNEKKI